MGRLLAILGFFLVLPTGLCAQVVESPSATPIAAPDPLLVLSSFSTAGQSPFGKLPQNPRARCCNRKRALVGAAIGVVLSVILTRRL